MVPFISVEQPLCMFCLEAFSSTLTQTLVTLQCDIHSSIIYMFKPPIRPRYSCSTVLVAVRGPEGREPQMHSRHDCTAADVAKNASIVCRLPKEQCHFGFASEPFVLAVVITACRPLGFPPPAPHPPSLSRLHTEEYRQIFKICMDGLEKDIGNGQFVPPEWPARVPGVLRYRKQHLHAAFHFGLRL